jgi:hypothetical protein
MADDTDRDATKLRFLAMAADYEARAKAADESIEPSPREIANELTEPILAETIDDVPEPQLEEAIKIEPVRRIVKELKKTILVERRPVGRPRRKWPWQRFL